ncbi:hypothetical protein R0J90_23810, partial [Micrococcus sp. SIMBA_144]
MAIRQKYGLDTTVGGADKDAMSVHGQMHMDGHGDMEDMEGHEDMDQDDMKKDEDKEDDHEDHG